MRQHRLRLRSLQALMVLLAALLWSPLAMADQLDDLRASGAVGERFDGYAEARDASQAAFVRQVNAKRNQIYAARAAEQGVAPDQVGRVYAKEIMSKAPSGTYFMKEDGSWIRKP